MALNKDLMLESYNFELPKELIAQAPLEKRDESKLLVYKNGQIEHLLFKDIIKYFSKDDIIIYNNTKVLKTKLFGKKETGGKVEVTLLKKIDNTTYKALLKMKNPKPGSKIIFNNELFAEILHSEDFNFIIKFNQDATEFIEKFGRVTLPPYVKNPNIKDEQYQTIFAKEPGSIAAPTAAFHFSKELLHQLEEKGVKFYPVSLHIGLGTFAPVKSDRITEHDMHEEEFFIPEETAQAINNRKGRLFLVGTTSLRALESSTDESGKVIPKKTSTKLFIYPGYKFKLDFDALITNFHLPKSTLVMLVAAIIGREEILRTYRIAIENNYRFFSFGDAMLILRNFNKF
ncbi:MAG: S-adenosylmethionine:tRNA ribosyltransferase-isomerase [Candidatus Woesearchaeota archaeon]|nr:S-adenosylmethionine:tRNA ribosyltransferase-isomerase [Candidatus Woesearchaeota archaeon]MDN5327727.1 S-adenosylmethionine:tRNA ribosyltransferase-isomerase [Candidatus Woesearchaeota archaeon]